MSVSTRNLRVTGIDMTGYMVKDTQRALDFYRNLHGLEPTTVYPDQLGAEFEFGDGTTFGIWTSNGTPPWRESSGVMSAVDDFDAALRFVNERGTTIHMQHESPVCFMARIEDSEGNHIILSARRSKPGRGRQHTNTRGEAPSAKNVGSW